jgi:3-dehydroquinate dehydratase type I
MKTPLICVSTYGENYKTLLERISQAIRAGADLVEARLDYLEEINAEKLAKALTPYASKLIITIRPVSQGGRFKGMDDERLTLLRRLSSISPAFMDLELDICEKYGVESGRSTIVSWHGLADTPDMETLTEIAMRCLRLGDYAKVVTYATSHADILRILHLYSDLPRNRLIAFCMGEVGRVSRILAMAAGSPVAYASLDGLTTAPGQMTLHEMRSHRERLVRSVSMIYGSALLSNR